MAYVYQAWPCWCTGPNGEGRVIEREEDVPEGWEHHGITVGAKKAHDAAPHDIKALRAEYEARFGKRPFMGWDADELRERMA